MKVFLPLVHTAQSGGNNGARGALPGVRLGLRVARALWVALQLGVPPGGCCRQLQNHPKQTSTAANHHIASTLPNRQHPMNEKDTWRKNSQATAIISLWFNLTKRARLQSVRQQSWSLHTDKWAHGIRKQERPDRAANYALVR